MSFAPESLINLRKYLRAKTGKPAANFSIRANCCYGYHLGGQDLDAQGILDTDYSARRPRDKAGLRDANGNLTNAAAGFDITLSAAGMKHLAAFLVSEARAGRIPDLVEIIGPNTDGDATDWRKPLWRSMVRKDPNKNDHHRTHIHLGWHRDSQQRDKIVFFEPLYGSRDLPLPDEQPGDDVIVVPTPPPPGLTVDELMAENAEVVAERDQLAALLSEANVKAGADAQAIRTLEARIAAKDAKAREALEL